MALEVSFVSGYNFPEVADPYKVDNYHSEYSGLILVFKMIKIPLDK